MRLPLFFAGALLSASLSAHAEPVLYTFTGDFSGVLGTTSFTDDAGTFSFVGDTSTVMANAGIYQNLAGVSTITLSGLGTATFLSTFGAESQSNAGAFYDSKTGFGVGTESSAFTTYALSAPFGPITGSFITNGAIAELTSLGNLTITDEIGPTTFTAAATATPEPSSFVLLGTGVLGLVGAVRRRFA